MKSSPQAIAAAAAENAARKAAAMRAHTRAEIDAILAGTSTQQFVHWEPVGAGHYVGNKCYRITRERSQLRGGGVQWKVAVYDGSWLMGTGPIRDVVRYLTDDGHPNGEFRTLGDAQARAQQHEIEIRQRQIRASGWEQS